MNNLLKNLNDEQLFAVTTTGGAILVLSGAGTGKTRVLTTRIAYILEQGLAAPWQILALTFTNKAANEMKNRVATIISDENMARDIWMGTFHSICLRILRRNFVAAELGPDFLVYGEEDQKTVLKNVIRDLNLDTKDYPANEWVEKISSIKDKGIDSPRSLDDRRSPTIDRIYNAYNTELSRLNAVDFADIILKTLKLFVSNLEILQKYQNQFKYIMVDEFQDTNSVQHQLLKLLSSASGNICCVGDDDQSIYSWRGAEIKNILNFEKDFKDAKIIRLETNYRSGEMILSAANSLIRHNNDRLGKDLKAAPGMASGEKVHVLEFQSGYDEARIIAETIQRGVIGGNNYNNFAILIRAGSLSRLFEEEFTSHQIPYRLIGTTKFYDRMEIRDVVAYARLLARPFDDLSLMRIISKPRRGFGGVFVDKIREFAGAMGGGMLRAMRSMPITGKQKTASDEFTNTFDFDWGAMSPDAAIAKVLETSGYMKMWRESRDADAKDRLSNINELLTNVISKYNALSEFLEHAALMMTDDNDAQSSGNAVAVMTIHAAKGLEFDTVFLPAWEEGIFPNEMAINDGSIEEERRLAYVALTRAKKLAVITSATMRVQFGTRGYNQPSRFITEIDKQFCKTRENIMQRNNYATPTHKTIKPKIQSADRWVGKLVNHAELGSGVVIEQHDNILTIAFKNRGIKKVEKSFVA